MPISPARSTGVRGSDAANPTLSTGAAKLTATLTSVTATHSAIVVTHAYKLSTPSGDLVTGVTVGGTSATLVTRVAQTDGARTETCIWIVPNLTSGDKAVVLTVNGPLYVNWHADTWAIATSSATDRTATAIHFNPGTATVAVPSSGTTASLAQATELVITAATGKFNWSWNGTYGGFGAPPSGYTALAGITEDNVNSVCFHTAYKETTTTTGQSATWGLVATDGNTTLALATFKIATVSRRVKFLADSAINGATGITAHGWIASPTSSYAEEWTGLTAEATGGIVYAADPPASWATGADVNGILYQPSGAKKGTSWVTGRVEEI